jgi:cathepsin A (carboxypeptidase C)
MKFAKTFASLSALFGTAQAVRKWTLDNSTFTGSLEVTAHPKGLCDDVDTTAGYFKITGSKDKNYFYWYFESRDKPATDPVILWMTGGPGCSSAIAQFHENGPCKINKDHSSTTKNPFSWNSHASIIYIDQPAGVGFSYGAPSVKPDSNEKMIAEDMYHFLHEFNAANNNILNTREFFVFGESYGGHYAPATAHRIQDSLNLVGLGVGNGLTDPVTQYQYYGQMAYNQSLAEIGHPSVTLDQYRAMESAVPGCIALIKKCAEDTTTCPEAQSACNNAEMSPYYNNGLNPYDIRKECGANPLCYDFSDVTDFLNDNAIKEQLGVPSFVQWQSCNGTVNSHFGEDWMKSFKYTIPDLLAAKVRVLIYAGDMDFVCNWLGNQAWTLGMEWPGQSAFDKEGMHAWNPTSSSSSSSSADGVVGAEPTTGAGMARTAEGFTFLRVFDAGHMVPLDQPQNALSMLQTFLTNGKFY